MWWPDSFPLAERAEIPTWKHLPVRQFVEEKGVQLKGERSDPERSQDHLEPRFWTGTHSDEVPSGFLMSMETETVRGPEKRALHGGRRSRPGTFFSLFQHCSQYLFCIIRATLWAKVSRVDPMVKVRRATCQVESKRRISEMHLLPFFGQIKKKHIPSGRTLSPHFPLPRVPAHFSPGLALCWCNVACS